MQKMRRQKHGEGKNRTYLYCAWDSIKRRCYNPKNANYHSYGGRGILIADEWLKDYVAFRDWMLANLGDRPEGYSLDRVDNNKGYIPGNLRWASQIDQCQNTRKAKSVRQLDLEGNYIATYTSMRQAARATGTNYPCIWHCVNGNYAHANGFKWST